MCEKPCMQVMSSFAHKRAHTHTQKCVCADSCALVSTHSHTHTKGKLNGKMFLSPTDIRLQNPTSFSFLTVDYLQCKCSFYQIKLFMLGKEEKSLKIYSDFVKKWNVRSILVSFKPMLDFLAHSFTWFSQTALIVLLLAAAGSCFQ